MHYLLLLNLFWAFFKVGLFSFGGGYAMLPVMEAEVITRFGWLTAPEFIDIIAVAETTPGPIAINSATYVGFRLAGFAGSIIATIAVALPSLLVLLTLGGFLLRLVKINNPRLGSVMQGLRLAVIALILLAAVSLGKTGLVDRATYAIAAALFFSGAFLRTNPFYLLAAGAVLGLIFYPY